MKQLRETKTNLLARGLCLWQVSECFEKLHNNLLHEEAYCRIICALTTCVHVDADVPGGRGRAKQ